MNKDVVKHLPTSVACSLFCSSQYKSGEWMVGLPLKSDSASHNPAALAGQLQHFFNPPGIEWTLPPIQMLLS